MEYKVIRIDEPSVLICTQTDTIVLKGSLEMQEDYMVLTSKEAFIDGRKEPLSLVALFWKESYGI